MFRVVKGLWRVVDDDKVAFRDVSKKVNALPFAGASAKPGVLRLRQNSRLRVKSNPIGVISDFFITTRTVCS